MKYPAALRFAPSIAIGVLLASCTTSVPLPPDPAPATVAPAASLPGTTPGPVAARPSGALTDRAYRADAASHVYVLNAERIWKGKLPPMLYAIGVLQVEVDGRGNVRHLNWLRAPKHAPEVTAEIERTVRRAAPFPAPAKMGKAVWTDTWLWHESGRFQLDTLSEGQE